MILFRVNGIDYKDINEIEFNKSLTEFCGGFSLSITDRNDRGILFNGQEECELVIEGESIFKGYIVSTDGSIDNDFHLISVSGNERTNDLVESDLTENIEFTQSIKLEDIIRKVLSSLGMDFISVKSNTTLTPFNTDETISGQVGENAFQFIEKYARKKQVLITTDRDGNILLQRSSSIPNGGDLQLIKNNPTNNILTSSYRKDFRKIFAQYTLKCSDNLSTGWVNKSFEERRAFAFDTTIRQSRRKEIVVDSTDIFTLRKMAIWEQNVRLNGGEYICKVQGFKSNNDQIWYPNMLVSVKDDIWGIEKNMIIKSCSYTQNNSGTFTNLNLVDPVVFSTIEDYNFNFNKGTLVKI